MAHLDPNDIAMVHIDCPTDHMSRRLRFVYKDGNVESFGLTPPEMTRFVRRLVKNVGPGGCCSFVQAERSRKLLSDGKKPRVPQGVKDDLPPGAEAFVTQGSYEEPEKPAKAEAKKAEVKEPKKG